MTYVLTAGRKHEAVTCFRKTAFHLWRNIAPASGRPPHFTKAASTSQFSRTSPQHSILVVSIHTPGAQVNDEQPQDQYDDLVQTWCRLPVLHRDGAASVHRLPDWAATGSLVGPISPRRREQNVLHHLFALSRRGCNFPVPRPRARATQSRVPRIAHMARERRQGQALLLAANPCHLEVDQRGRERHLIRGEYN